MESTIGGANAERRGVVYRWGAWRVWLGGDVGNVRGDMIERRQESVHPGFLGNAGKPEAE